MAEVVESVAELTEVTPMMQQYLDVKKDYKDYVLLYRLGDFYEMFFEDAVVVSRELELTLTARDCGNGRRAAMCGVPFHKADLYIGKLVERGHKVAVCEQTEDPSQAKGLVRREVIRVVTPGTVTDGSILNDRCNNFLAALSYAGKEIGLAFADVSTGQIYATVIAGDDVGGRLRNEIGAYAPKEMLLDVSRTAMHEIADFAEQTFGTLITDGRAILFDENDAARAIAEITPDRRYDSVSLLRSVGALLAYIKETQMCNVSFIKEINVYTDGQFMELDLNTRRNLELVETMRTKEKRGSLLWVLDKTETAMGARLLRSWVLKPLLDPAAIGWRQRAIGELCESFLLREELRANLARVLDLERLTARAVYGTASPKDLHAILQSISVLPEICRLLADCHAPRLSEIRDGTDPLSDICALLSASLVDEPPFSVRDGNIIRDGYNADVDQLRNIQKSGKGWIEQIEAREREATGIKTLRIHFNKVFGYYIEVTKSLIDQVPDRYVRKQTLTGCERYITEELKNMETTVLGAEDKLNSLEYTLFNEIRQKIAEQSARIQATASCIAELDVYLSLADVAVKNHYVCPEILPDHRILIKDGRHPVVERFVTDRYFVPNDTTLDTGANRLMLITGPNMAGKSTYMRQVALISVMAQIGSFVPAREASLGIVDKVFTRVGASDDLASGQSTFMLEMNEVAHILDTATDRSLIVYDEVGRGTSTFDGMSIARAVAEFTLERIGAKTLFATHYHELTVMEEEFSGVVNYNVAAKKRGDSITFLRKIVRGATDDSYGIEVAKLAGVPNSVVKRAREILASIEDGTLCKPTVVKTESNEPDMLSVLASDEANAAADRIRALDLNTLTPIEALNFIFELKKLLNTER